MGKSKDFVSEIENASMVTLDKSSVDDGRKPAIFRAGRGNGGGTTALNVTAELALMEGRSPLILDAARNAGLANFYPDRAVRPKSHNVSDVNQEILGIFDKMVESGEGALIDVGGGQDDIFVKAFEELDIVEFGKDAGIRPVFYVTFGPDMGDFDHALEIKSRGIFNGADVLLIQSGGVLRQNQDAAEVFGKIRNRKEYLAWEEEGARALYLPLIPPLEEVRAKGLSLRDAAADKLAADGTKLGFSKAWQVKNVLNKWRQQFEVIERNHWRV